jgi:hypothetical protein
LARLAVNFKNAGNGGLFNVFEVPQTENGWKMENGKWKTVTTDSANCCDATRDFLEADFWPAWFSRSSTSELPFITGQYF